MKNTIIQLFAFLLCLPFVNAQQMTKEEAAVLETIEKSEEAFAKRDFDAWASSWVQEPYAVWYGANPNDLWDWNGWKEIEVGVRNNLKRHPNPGIRPKFSDIVFLVKDNLATVQLSTSTAQRFYTLEKKGDQWKIAARHRYWKSSYEAKKHSNQFDRLAGAWQLDPSSVEMVNNENTYIAKADCQTKVKPGGLYMEIQYRFDNKAGEVIWHSVEEIILYEHSPNNQMVATINSRWERPSMMTINFSSSVTNLSSVGESEFLEDGSIKLTTEQPGENGSRVQQIIRIIESQKIELQRTFNPGQDNEWGWKIMLVKD